MWCCISADIGYSNLRALPHSLSYRKITLKRKNSLANWTAYLPLVHQHIALQNKELPNLLTFYYDLICNFLGKIARNLNNVIRRRFNNSLITKRSWLLLVYLHNEQTYKINPLESELHSIHQLLGHTVQ